MMMRVYFLTLQMPQETMLELNLDLSDSRKRHPASSESVRLAAVLLLSLLVVAASTQTSDRVSPPPALWPR